ncbi:MAG: hypothetical protein MI744_07415 [Pseudomonadales bacterium]|jgi:hypothetical protein|nr:hypothetical protein [Pseudomonadales bacterium]
MKNPFKLLGVRRINKKTLGSLGALLVAISISSGLQAQEEIADGTPMNTNDRFYEGAINAIHAEESILIVDDESFTLDRLVQFRNTVWSREQVLQQIQPGDSIRLELSPDTAGGSRPTVAVGLSVIRD